MLTLIDRVRLECVPVVYRPRHVVGMPRQPDQLRSRFIATWADQRHLGVCDPPTMLASSTPSLLACWPGQVPWTPRV